MIFLSPSLLMSLLRQRTSVGLHKFDEAERLKSFRAASSMFDCKDLVKMTEVHGSSAAALLFV